MHYIFWFIFKIIVITGLAHIFRDDKDSEIGLKTHANEFSVIKKYRRIGFLSLAFSAFLLSIGFLYEDELFIIPIIVGFFIMLLSVILLLSYFNYKVIVDNNTLTIYNLLGIKKRINWDEVEEIKINENFEFIKILSNGNKYKIGFDLYHINKLVKKIEMETKIKIGKINRFIED